MKTYSPKENEVPRGWVVVDAEDKILGRLATQIVSRLRGKNKPEFAPHIDTGDFVVVINAEKVRVTGRKLDQEMLERKPEQVLYNAVKGMLPKNRVGRRQLKKLKIYVGPEHPHQAQQPATLDI